MSGVQQERAQRAVPRYRVRLTFEEGLRRTWRGARVALFWGGPFLFPAAAAYYLYLFYDNLPERFPLHWSQLGKPDQWADKSVQGVFFAPVMAGLVLLFTALAELLIFAAHRTAPVQESAPGEDERTRAAQRVKVGWLNWLLGLIFGVLAVLPGVAPEDFQLPAWVMATGAFALVVSTLFATLRIRR